MSAEQTILWRNPAKGAPTRNGLYLFWGTIEKDFKVGECRTRLVCPPGSAVLRWEMDPKHWSVPCGTMVTFNEHGMDVRTEVFFAEDISGGFHVHLCGASRATLQFVNSWGGYKIG